VIWRCPSRCWVVPWGQEEGPQCAKHRWHLGWHVDESGHGSWDRNGRRARRIRPDGSPL